MTDKERIQELEKKLMLTNLEILICKYFINAIMPHLERHVTKEQFLEFKETIKKVYSND